MFIFILLVGLSLIFGYFATQNTQQVTITLAHYVISDIPLYIVFVVTLLIGFALSWIISLSDSFSAALRMRGKESKIKDGMKNIHNLTKRVNDLEIENARLKGKAEKHESL